MVWLVVGGSGQLGTALHEILSKQNVKHMSVGTKELDLTQPIDKGKFHALQLGAIINCAAWTDVERAEDNEEEARLINSFGAKNLAKLSRELEVPFVQISTDYVFSGAQDEPWREDQETNPLSVYGKTKSEGEQEVLSEYSSGSYIIRTAWLYSPWRRNFVKTILQRALNGMPSKVVSDQVGQPTSALDLAEQILLILNRRPSTGIYHGTNSGKASWYELALEIYRLAGMDSNLVTRVTSEVFPTRVLRPRNSVLDHEMWLRAGIPPMRDWRIALASVFPHVLSEVKRELPND